MLIFTANSVPKKILFKFIKIVPYITLSLNRPQYFCAINIQRKLFNDEKNCNKN